MRHKAQESTADSRVNIILTKKKATNIFVRTQYLDKSWGYIFTNIVKVANYITSYNQSSDFI